jgi:hypothetical protein
MSRAAAGAGLLLQAEVRLAKARATVVGAEVDIKVVGARLRALTK